MTMMNRVVNAAVWVSFMAVAFASTSCGPSLAQIEQRDACLGDCQLGWAECLETRTCRHIDGQLIPCEEECAAGRDACEEGCG